MRLVLGFAGIPNAIYDGFWRNRAKVIESGDLLFSETYKNGTTEYYAQTHSEFFMKRFASALRDDDHNSLADFGFAIIYIATHPGAQDFAHRFFPSILTVPVRWNLRGENRTTLGQSLNELLLRLREATQVARASLGPLKKELTEGDNRTPWLLPIRNFQSKVLMEELTKLQSELTSSQDVSATLKRAKNSFDFHHAPQKVGTKTRRCYVDNSGVEFHSPGAARHAFARGSFEGHPLTCFLSGRRRLGSPYDRAFHYDCARGEAPLKGEFAGCHTAPESRVGSPHLNIAPNDFVRS